MNEIRLSHNLFNKHQWKIVKNSMSSSIVFKCYCGMYFVIGSESY